MFKKYGFLSFTRNLSNKCGKQLPDTASKKVIHKAVKLLGNKIADVLTES